MNRADREGVKRARLDTNTDLDAIEARANAAYPGPWRAGTVEAEGKVWAHDPEALGGPVVGERCVFIANRYFEHTANREFVAHARKDVPDLVAEVRRLRGLLDAETAAHRGDLRDDAKALDDLVAQVWRATGETHEPPADVAAMLARVTALRESHRERSEALLTARRWADDAQRLLDAKEGTGREEELARQLHADAGARVAAARREGAEAMREACADICDTRAVDRGSDELQYAARALRALPLPGGEP